MIYRLIIFFVLNFGALALGGLFTGKGASSDWYAGLAQAPWTPPGWVFGAAWTTIMVCFSIYMAYAWTSVENKPLLLGLYITQLILNISWNPIFFYYHNVLAGLLVISLLTVIVGFFLFYYWSDLRLKSALIIPYFVWLMIATSLNGFIWFRN